MRRIDVIDHFLVFISQSTTPEDTPLPLDDLGINNFQKIVGSSLIYNWAVNTSILVAIVSISSNQAK